MTEPMNKNSGASKAAADRAILNGPPDSRVSPEQRVLVQTETRDPEYGSVRVNFHLSGNGLQVLQMSRVTAASLRDQLDQYLNSTQG